MKLNRIICPVDFSETSTAAFPWACRLAHESEAILIIVHVSQVATSYDTEPPKFLGVPKGLVGDRAKLHAITPVIKNVKCEHHHLIGDPGEEILRIAAREKADAIVMGSHGRTGLLVTLLGSVTEFVLRRAPCPVLILCPTPESGS